MRSFWRHCFLWTDLRYCSGVSIIDFEQVNFGWEGAFEYDFRFVNRDSSVNLQISYFNISTNFIPHQTTNYRSSRPEVFCKKGILKNFTKFTGKHLCQSLFFNKVAGLRPATLSKTRLWHRCFPVNLVKFLRTPFYRTPLDDCFCNHHKSLGMQAVYWKRGHKKRYDQC